MKPFIVTEHSLHWRLASFYGPMHADVVRHHGTDICTYMRAVLNGLVKVLLITAGCSMGAAFTADFLAWLVAGFVTSFVTPGPGAVVIGGIVAIVCGVMLWLWLKELVEDYLDKREQNTDEGGRQPSFVSQAFSSFNNKYCIPVKLEQ